MPDSPHPLPVKKLRGKVTRGTYGKGTKSERETLFIETEKGRFVLRRKTGPAFADTQLDRYFGRTVECDGFLVGTTLLAEHIELAS
jgi:hypothetical protein